MNLYIIFVAQLSITNIRIIAELCIQKSFNLKWCLKLWHALLGPLEHLPRSIFTRSTLDSFKWGHSEKRCFYLNRTFTQTQNSRCVLSVIENDLLFQAMCFSFDRVGMRIKKLLQTSWHQIMILYEQGNCAILEFMTYLSSDFHCLVKSLPELFASNWNH